MRPFPGNGLPPGTSPVMIPIQRPPTEEEIDETKRVQGLQIRTNATQFAIALLAGQSANPDELVANARVIERYITGEG